MIYRIAEWFEMARYDDKNAISLVDTVETTWISRYPIPMEITHD